MPEDYADPLGSPGSSVDDLQAMLFTKEPWRQHAACRGADPEIFFSDFPDDQAIAKGVCATCPVQEACLDSSLVNREDDAVWGGMTAGERRGIRRRRREGIRARGMVPV
jgi:WhiB family redox-sensing transcriptional regulator